MLSWLQMQLVIVGVEVESVPVKSTHAGILLHLLQKVVSRGRLDSAKLEISSLLEIELLNLRPVCSPFKYDRICCK